MLCAFIFSDGDIADIRTSLLDIKQSHGNGSTDLTHDKLAQRDSYAAFGNTGDSDEGADEVDSVPDLMGYVCVYVCMEGNV